MMRSVFFIIICMLTGIHAVNSEASDPLFTEDIQSYCKYIDQKHQAQMNVLYAPDVVVRVQNSNNDALLQNNLVSGLSKDLSDFTRAKLIKTLAHDECNYYRLHQEAKWQIQFAIPQLHAEALKFKLQLIQNAKIKLNRILGDIQKKIASHHDTMHHYYQVDSILEHLKTNEHEIHVRLALQQLPKIRPIKIRQLLNQLEIAQRARQATRNKLKKQDNWSLEVQAGAQQAISMNQKQSMLPYAGLFVRYNLGSIPSSGHVDKSLNDYMNWKNKQVNGVQKQLSDLMLSIAELKSTEHQQLNSLTLNDQKYAGFSKNLHSIHSTKATHFSQQVEIDRLLVNIEIQYVKRMIDLIDQFS